jgi:hypothetical protein
MTMLPGVRVSGRGIGAATAAQALAARGIGVAADLDGVPAPRQAPLVMLGDQAQALLCDVFAGNPLLAAALNAAHPIARRIVRWGNAPTQIFTHSARVIAGSTLVEAVWSPPPPWAGDAAFVLSTAPSTGVTLLRFGAREAAAAPVVLEPAADCHAAYVESLDRGWLFLIPTGGGIGWLLAVGADPAEALIDSALIAPVVAETGAIAARFETAPRLLDDPCAEGRLTLGSAALAFDPICGDGTATATRGGLLAAAVAAALAGADAPLLDPAVDGAALAMHYRLMLIAAMRRHLATSWSFYARGGNGPWWQGEAAALADGHAWCTRQLGAAGEARFVLAGDRLIHREAAA